MNNSTYIWLCIALLAFVAAGTSYQRPPLVYHCAYIVQIDTGTQYWSSTITFNGSPRANEIPALAESELMRANADKHWRKLVILSLTRL